MPEFFAFIDESGDSSLDTEKSGVSRYYTLAAVIVKEGTLYDLENAIEIIRNKHYSKGEIKSSNTDDRRRLKIITELADVNFKLWAIAIDKREVYRDGGLVHKKSFIKFTNSILYGALVRSYQDIEIRADQHGREEFMASFRSYIRENHIPDLFQSSTVAHVRSHDAVLVQLADFLAGTIRKIYEGTTSREVRDAFLHLIKERKLAIDEWPPVYARQTDARVETSEFDGIVYKVSMNAASAFVTENQHHANDEGRIQLIVLKYLLFNAKYGEGEYISTGEILDHLSSNGYAGISDHQLKSTVISRLRDNDVLISSSNRGYKIPQTYRDFMDFVELVNGQSIPLLDRLNRAKRALNIASLGTINPLGDTRYNKLRLVAEALESDKF